jgi:hypothetical protein
VDEPGVLHLGEEADALEDLVGRGGERLAHVVAGMDVALDHHHIAPVLGEQRRQDRTGRTPSDDDHVERRL